MVCGMHLVVGGHFVKGKLTYSSVGDGKLYFSYIYIFQYIKNRQFISLYVLVYKNKHILIKVV